MSAMTAAPGLVELDAELPASDLVNADIAPTPYAWEIRATGLKVRAGRKRMAVDGLDLSLSTGVHGLLGPNGAGKTTLIRALATVLRPAGGTLELLGESVGGRGEHRALRLAGPVGELAHLELEGLSGPAQRRGVRRRVAQDVGGGLQTARSGARCLGPGPRR